MPNSLNTLPAVIDTDITSWRTASGYLQGVRVIKITLAVGASAASSAGVVSITAPSDSSLLLYPLLVPAGQPAYTVLYNENQDVSGVETWRDFAVTGLTATGTRLFVWYKV
jgi:hypothetical protein